MSVLAKLVAVKAVLALAGATAVSGVALAAATGSLPATLQDAAHDAVGAPAASHPSPSATPSPDTTGLCRAYQAGVADAHGKATESPAFVALATAAGSADGVDAYCSALLADQPGGKPTDLPSQAASHQPAHPSGPPATHGAPDTHPTRAPVPHPTGPPAR